MIYLKALEFAAEQHKGQERRGTKLPYIMHPIAVSELVLKYKPKSKHILSLRIAALMHDVIEDCSATYMDLEREFGPLVASLVQELTSDKKMAKEMGKNEYLCEKMVQMSKYAFFLKLCDRLSNIMDEPGKKYIEYTLVLMKYIKLHREDVSDTQARVIQEITKMCIDRSKASY